jgi:hypothetical protein
MKERKRLEGVTIDQSIILKKDPKELRFAVTDWIQLAHD